MSKIMVCVNSASSAAGRNPFPVTVQVKKDQMAVWQVDWFRNRHTERGVIHLSVSH